MDAKLIRFHHVLRGLARHGALRDDDVDPALCELLKTAAETLEVERVGAWLLEPDRICLRLGYTFGERHFSRGAVVLERVAPRYFQAVRSDGTIDAHEALSDPRTSELAESYLIPTRTGALLDVPIWVRGRLAGVVCHEHVGGMRRWTAEEMTFAASIADLVALLLEGEERRLLERALREREIELAVALEAAGMGAWSWHLGEDQIWWDPRVPALYGREPGWVPGSLDDFLSLILPEEREAAGEQLRRALEGPSAHFTLEHRTAVGDRWLEARGRVWRGADGSPEALFGVVWDATEKRRAADRAARDRHLEALGRLAAGVAHDFNNVLASIVASSELLAPHVRGPQPQAWLQSITVAAMRASELTRHLMAFARGHQAPAATVDLVASLRAALITAEPLLPPNVTLAYAGLDEPVWVAWNASQIEQVLLNLILNARDAMPDGGSIRVSLAVVERRAVWVVEDSGAGMPPQVLDRIFEPFFTTKAMGSGTGLGLATSYGYVASVGGTMSATSEPGRGSAIRIELPLAEAPREVEPETPGVLRAGLPRVLLVEDRDDVRVLVTEVLRRAGHEVVPARGREDALNKEARPQVLVVDVALADGSGVDLARALSQRDPRLGVVFISGYAPEHVPLDVGRATRFLAKPFRNQALLDAVAEVAPEIGRS